MIRYILTAFVGYLLGSLNPAALIARVKHKNLRKYGTENLGATNVMLNFGKKFGVAVMAFDIAKAFISYKLAEFVFPTCAFVGMVAGGAAVIGHIFPFYLGFKGGKGLAAFGGLVLAYDPLVFVCMLVTAVILMIIVNYSFIMPFYAGIVFPCIVAARERDLLAFIVALLVSALLIFKHYGNMIKAKNGEDNKIREYIKKLVK